MNRKIKDFKTIESIVLKNSAGVIDLENIKTTMDNTIAEGIVNFVKYALKLSIFCFLIKFQNVPWKTTQKSKRIMGIITKPNVTA